MSSKPNTASKFLRAFGTEIVPDAEREEHNAAEAYGLHDAVEVIHDELMSGGQGPRRYEGSRSLTKQADVAGFHDLGTVMRNKAESWMQTAPSLRRDLDTMQIRMRAPFLFRAKSRP